MARENLLSGNTTILLLKLMEEQDMYGYQIIEELAARSDERKFYSLTNKGRGMLAKKQAEWSACSKTSGRVLEGGAVYVGIVRC